MFYIVWNERLWSSYTYPTLEEAQEAKLIAEKDKPDLSFYILRTIRNV